jgi:hypothetical protein
VFESLHRVEDHRRTWILAPGPASLSTWLRCGVLFVEVLTAGHADRRRFSDLDRQSTGYECPNTSSIQLCGGNRAGAAVQLAEEVLLPICESFHLLCTTRSLYVIAGRRGDARQSIILFSEAASYKGLQDPSIKFIFGKATGMLSETMEKFRLLRSQAIGQHGISVYA